MFKTSAIILLGCPSATIRTISCSRGLRRNFSVFGILMNKYRVPSGRSIVGSPVRRAGRLCTLSIRSSRSSSLHHARSVECVVQRDIFRRGAVPGEVPGHRILHQCSPFGLPAERGQRAIDGGEKCVVIVGLKEKPCSGPTYRIELLDAVFQATG